MAPNGKFDPKAILNDQVASQMLDNIFRSCSITPSAVPLQQLQSWGKYKRTDFRLCQWITGILLFLLLLVPVFFIPSSMALANTPNGSGEKATLTFSINSLLPVFHVKAALNGRALAVVPVKHNSFTTDIVENGELSVAITLVNGRSTYYNLTIDSVVMDKQAPVITTSTLENNQLTIFVTDEKSKVDFTSAYALDAAGNKITPLSYNEATGAVVFPYYFDTLNLFIADTRGNELQAVVSSDGK